MFGGCVNRDRCVGIERDGDLAFAKIIRLTESDTEQRPTLVFEINLKTKPQIRVFFF